IGPPLSVSGANSAGWGDVMVSRLRAPGVPRGAGPQTVAAQQPQGQGGGIGVRDGPGRGRAKPVAGQRASTRRADSRESPPLIRSRLGARSGQFITTASLTVKTISAPSLTSAW